MDIAADIIALKAETVLIVADTNELQGDWTNAGRLDTILDAILVDTGTTLQAELDAIQAAVITNAAGVDIAADIIALKAETVLIVADTNELQGDWTNTGRLDTILDSILTDTGTTLDGKIDTISTNVDQIETAVITNAAGTDIAADIIALKAETVLIVADTNELQGDWTNTGRLDTILDSILTDTVEIGTAGDGLTDITLANDFSATMKTSVQTAVDAALDTAIVELGVAIPTATPTVRTGIMLPYMALRNRLDVNTDAPDLLEIHNDAGTRIASKTVTDDGSDYSEAKMAAG